MTSKYIKNRRIAEIFSEMSRIYNILGDEFRSIAYIKVVRNINKFPQEITIDNIDNISGVGKGIREKILEILATGHLKALDDLKKHPNLQSMERLLNIKGFSQTKILELIKEYNVMNPDDIKRLHSQGKIKLNKNQLLGLKYASDLVKKIPRREIELFGKELSKIISKLKAKMEIVGSYRRKKDFSGDIDIIVYNPKNKRTIDSKLIDEIIEGVTENQNIKIIGTFGKGKTKFSGLIKTKYSPYVRQLDILNIPMDNYIPALLHFTGSGLFNRRIRLIAKEKGCKLSEKGLECHGKKIQLKKEKDVFDILELKYLKPENRNI